MLNLHMLDKLYPNYIFDIATEQQKLVDADVIVIQFPFFVVWNGKIMFLQEGESYADRNDETKLAQIHEKAINHASRLVKQINKTIS